MNNLKNFVFLLMAKDNVHDSMDSRYWGWSSMRCCLTSVDANACNFSVEDEKCSRYAIRSAH